MGKGNKGLSLVGVIIIIAVIVVLLIVFVPKLNKTSAKKTITKTKTIAKTEVKEFKKNEIAENNKEETNETAVEEMNEKGEENNNETEESEKKVTKSPAIKLLKPPKVIKKVYPEYPKEAKDKRIQGTVILECQTNEKGKVVSVKVLRGHPSLTEAAVSAAKQWKFEPYKIDGITKPVKFTLTIKFTFDKDEKK